MQGGDEAQGHVGIGGSVRGGIFDGDLGEAGLLLAFADEGADGGHLYAQAMAGEVFQPFMFATGIGEPFGDHGVEGDGRDGEAVLVEDGVIIFGIVGDFADGGVAHGGTDGVKNGRFPQLLLFQHRLAREQPHLPRIGLRHLRHVADGDVVARRRLYGQADAHNVRFHFVQTGRFHIEADDGGVF